MTQQYDVLIAGSYFCDMVFTGLPEIPQLGRDIFSRGFAMVPGGSFYMALAMQRLGINVGWMGHFGTDLFSRFIQEAAAREGIDPGLFHLYDRPIQRIAASFSFGHDRGFVSYMDDLDETIALDVVVRTRPRCLILHGLHFWEQINALQQLENRAEFAVMLDCQDSVLNLKTNGMVDALQKIDVFLPNESEACHFTGESTVERALACLAEIVPLVVIKCGKDGAIAQRSQEIVKVPALHVNVIDTTGAGDSFNAGFTLGHLRGESLEMCLRYANIVGGRSTTAPGGQAVPHLDGLLSIAQNYENYC